MFVNLPRMDAWINSEEIDSLISTLMHKIKMQHQFTYKIINGAKSIDF